MSAADERESKEFLTQELLAFGLGAAGEAPEYGALPPLPLDGRFRSAEDYAQLWQGLIVCEMRAQVVSVASNPSSNRARAALPAQPLHDDMQGRWALGLLAGEWVDQKGHCLVFSEFAPGRLQVSDKATGWAAELGPPGVGGWRPVGCGGGGDNRAQQVRLRDWNTLEVWGGQLRRRAYLEVRPSCVVLLSGASGGLRLGVVQRHRDLAAVRLAPDGEDEAGPTSAGQACEARVLSVSLTSSARELCAVRGARSMPSSLLEELLGEPAHRPPEWQPLAPKGKALAPCLAKLNASQLKAVDAAYNHQAGFSLIWGPPGTGKSATLLSLINALHLWEYERLHRAVERIALEPNAASDNDRWHAAVRCAPRLLVTASSNAAVEGLMSRVCAEKFLDRQGNTYEPWGIIRVGTDRGPSELQEIDLDQRVQTLLNVPSKDVEERLSKVRANLHALHKNVARLRWELQRLQEAVPLPPGWEARLSAAEAGRVEFHDHVGKRATWQRPEQPPQGAACVRLLELPHAVQRLGALMRCADHWWQLHAEEQRLAWLSGRVHGVKGDHTLRQRLEASFIGNAHIVFATLNSAARLRPHAEKHTPFGAVVVDEAAQATEPSVLVPLELARSRRCVLVGDDRQLPPTIFSPPKARGAALAARTLFERLRQLGHHAQLLAEQYRMAPEISAFPRAHFYGGALRDAPGMLESTRRRLHEVFPPLLFVDLEASAGEHTPDGSWRNLPEARLCAELLKRLRAAAEERGEEETAEDVGVLTPYRAQQEALRQEIRRQRLSLEAKAVQTVDAFQGRECEVIVFSAVRAPELERGSGGGLGFLADERRLNVALTRAKSLLVVVGHAPTLARSTAWGALLRHVRGRPGAYRRVRSEMGQDWLAS